MLTQTRQEEGEEMSKVSRINQIDLAGSERSSMAMTSGERLKVRGGEGETEKKEYRQGRREEGEGEIGVEAGREKRIRGGGMVWRDVGESEDRQRR